MSEERADQQNPILIDFPPNVIFNLTLWFETHTSSIIMFYVLKESFLQNVYSALLN